MEPSGVDKNLARSLMIPKSLPSEEEIGRIIKVCRNCCSDKSNCIGKYCLISPQPGSSPSRKPMTNLNQFRDIINSCQDAIRTKTDQERATFLLNQIKQAATFSNEPTVAVSASESPARKRIKKTTFAFVIPVNESTSITVCKKAWYNIFGFTEYEFNKCAELLRSRSPMDALATITRSPTRRFTDATVLNITHDEMNAIFCDNLPPSDYGM
jgi:hypothetical protein